MSEVVRWIGAALLVAGTGLTLIASLALIRFKDLLARQHAATKPQVLGLILMVTAAALIVQDARLGWTVALVVAFQLVTSPISAHMLSRAGYRTGRVVSSELVVDELRDDLVDPDDQVGPGLRQ